MGHEGMRSSLVSREVIADSVELTIRGHGYDALVGVAGCDKSLPGMMMAMLRLNVPSVFLYGGSIMPGRWRGRDVTVVDVFEGVGQHSAGQAFDRGPHPRWNSVACPGDGACGGQYTANTMACVAEAIGLALPLSSAPAGAEPRPRRLCRRLGRGGGGADRVRTAAPRHLHPQGVRERRRGHRRHRRFDQRCAAPAGHGPRVRHRVQPAGRGRDLPPHALPRGPQAGRPVCRQGHGRGGRRADADAHPAGRGPAARRLHHRHRQVAGGEPAGRAVARPEGDPPGRAIRCRPPAGWRGCGAASLRTGPS